MDSSQALYKVVTVQSGIFFLWADDFEQAGKLAREHLEEMQRLHGDRGEGLLVDIKSIAVHVPEFSKVINQRG